MELLPLFRAVRNASTPITVVRTPDPAQTQRSITDVYNGSVPILTWDILRGCQWRNSAGFLVAWVILLGKDNTELTSTQPSVNDTEEAKERKATGRQELQLLAREELKLKTSNLPELLDKAETFPKDTILFIQNAHLYFGKEDVLQGIWNLRDPFKADRRTLVLLCIPGASLPPELVQDVTVLDEEFPSLEELSTIVLSQYNNAGADPPAPATLDKAVDAVCGLAAFPAEQETAMSFVRRDSRITLDLNALWERKRQRVEAIRGLSTWRGEETYKDIGGVALMKDYLRSLIQGAEPPRVLVLLDEFEKAMAGSGGADTSGTATEMEGTVLKEMENQAYTGMIFIGVAGSCKTYLVKCAGGEFGIPVVMMEISEMKAKFVGSSTENLVQALGVVRAISQGRALFIATCNGMVNITGPMKRRFNFGTYMFDLPSAEERVAIWPIHLKRYSLEGKRYALPADDGWTGAEIRNCCMVAYRTGKTLEEAAMFVTPQARIDAENIEKLRQLAHNRYLSASFPGLYQYNRVGVASTPAAVIPMRRTIAVEEEAAGRKRKNK